MDPLFLTEIRRLPDTGSLRLTWNDGHSADLTYDLVRGYCPCATCQGHGSGLIRYQAPTQPVTPLNIEPVGHYAVSIEWSDRHATGIYRFDLLREICPCPECLDRRRQRGDASVEGDTTPPVRVDRLA